MATVDRSGRQRRRHYKQRWNYVNRIALALLMTIACSSKTCADAGDESLRAADGCATYKTCPPCANDELCSWRLEKQTCAKTKRTPGDRHVVHHGARCPVYRIDGSPALADRPTAVRIEILNDATGFARYLSDCKNISVYMRIAADDAATAVLDGRMVGNRIESVNVTVPSASFCAMLASCDIKHGHYHVEFCDGTRLRPDDEAQLYVPFYVDESTRDAVVRDSCVNCAWTADGVAHYLTWCGTRDAPKIGQEGVYGNRILDHGASVFPTAAFDAGDVLVQRCPRLRIRSVEPLYGRRTGGTAVTVNVTNHRIAVETAGTEPNVTVAGRRCEVVRSEWSETRDDDDDDAITCVVQPAETAVQSGPVEVSYLVDDVVFRLVSAQTFRFVEPEVTDARPACGPPTGGTRLTVTVANLSAVRRPTVAVGNATCASTAVTGPNTVECVTAAASPASGRVRVRLTDGAGECPQPQPSVPSSAWFTYANEPELDAGQRLTGIASGGTELSVSGRGFSCAKFVAFYAVDAATSARLVSEPCRVHDDGHAFCRPPRFAACTVTRLPYGLLAEFAGRTVDMQTRNDSTPQPLQAYYEVHPDPALDEFVVNGSAVIVRGRGLGRGYGAGDVAVRFTERPRADPGPDCVVTEADERRIVCEVKVTTTAVTADDNDLDDVFVVWVKIGRTVEYKVRRKFVVSGDVFRMLTT